MKFMNQHNVVHRDIKVDNILVRSRSSKLSEAKRDSPSARIEEFEFKVADLGLAKAVTSRDDMIKTLCGTPVCMAPEIVAGAFYNYKVDVWSVGTLLFHLLTGTYPFKGRSIEELKSNLARGAYKIPRDVTISFECLDFINCCLKFESKKRKNFEFLFAHPFLL